MTDELVARLESDARFEFTEARVGSAELLEVRHLASRMRFVVVPGGRFSMGFSAEEMGEARRELGVAPGRPGADFYRPLFEAAHVAAQPVHEADVPAFVCARHAVPDALVAEALRGRTADVNAREYFPDIAAWDDGFSATGMEATYEDELEALGGEAPDWMLEEAEMCAGPGAEPAILFGREVPSVLESDALGGLRLLSEAEWELVARAGGARRWLDDPGRVSEHPYGIWGLFFGTWVWDAHRATYDAPARRSMVPNHGRGGSWEHYPFQDAAEALDQHCAYRPSTQLGDSGRLGLLLAADV